MKLLLVTARTLPCHVAPLLVLVSRNVINSVSDWFISYGPDHGSGDPHMNWDDKPLKDSKVWRSHKSEKPKK